MYEKLLPQKIFQFDTCLFQNSSQCSLRHVAGVIGDGGIAVGLLIVPDLMASARLAVKHEAECFKALDDPAIFKT